MRSLAALALLATTAAQSGDVLELYAAAGCTGTAASVTVCQPGSCCYLGTSPTGMKYVKMSADMQFYCKLTGHVQIGIHDDPQCSTSSTTTLTATANPQCETAEGFNIKYKQTNVEYSKFLCGLRQDSVEYYIQVEGWMEPQCFGLSEQRYDMPLSGFESSRGNEKMDRSGKKLDSCPDSVKPPIGECGVMYHDDNGCAPEYVRTDWSCDLNGHLHIGNRPFSDPECTIPKAFLGTMLRVPTTHLPITGECVSSVEGLSSYRAVAASNYTMTRMCNIINADPALRQTLKFMPYQQFVAEYPLVKNAAAVVSPCVAVFLVFVLAFIVMV